MLRQRFKAELREALAACEARRNEVSKNSVPLDFAMLFAKSPAGLSRQFAQPAKLLAPAGILWVSWPKKSSGVATDLDGNEVRAIGLAAGLVDVKVCAVTEIWSGLEFVRRVKDRKPIKTRTEKPSATAH